MKVHSGNFLFALSKIRLRQFLFLEEQLSVFGVVDLSPSYGDVLFALDQKGPMALREIASLTNKDKSTVSSVIRKLEQTGYVTKKKGKGDARYVIIELTAKARKLKPLLLEISDEMNENLFRGLNRGEKAQLFKLIEKIAENATSDAEANHQT
jgi:DNA-binding MarR family transcriptional regulator